MTHFEYDGKQKLHIKVQNGQKQKEWHGKVPHRVLAQRMHEKAQSALQSKHENIFEQNQSRQKSRAKRLAIVAPLRTALSSAIIPGLGQWLQMRKDDALAYFMMAVPLLGFLGFLLWLQSVPKTDVEPGLLLTVAIAYTVIAVFSAWEAYSHSQSKLFDAQMNNQQFE